MSEDRNESKKQEPVSGVPQGSDASPRDNAGERRAVSPPDSRALAASEPSVHSADRKSEGEDASDMAGPATDGPPSGKRRATLAVTAVLLALALAGGGYFLRDLWLPSLAQSLPWLNTLTAEREQPETPPQAAPSAMTPPPVTATGAPDRLPPIVPIDRGHDNAVQQVASLQERIETLEQTVVALQERLNAASSAEITVRQLPQELSQRLVRVETEAARVAALDARLQSVEAAVRAPREGLSGAAATVLAITQLAQALKGSGPYATELAAARALEAAAGDIRKELDVLEPRSARGIPTLAALQARFPEVAADVVRADRLGSAESWFDRVLTRITGLVTIRRTGAAAAAADGTEALLARAEESLSAGDLQMAVNAMAGLTGPAGEAAAPWLEEARARLLADQSLAALQVRAIAALRASKG